MGAIGQFDVPAAFSCRGKALGTNTRRLGEPQSPFGFIEKRQDLPLQVRIWVKTVVMHFDIYFEMAAGTDTGK
jgi:hypothetical protein